MAARPLPGEWGTDVLTFLEMVGALNSGQNTPTLAVTGFNRSGASVYETGFPATAADMAEVYGIHRRPADRHHRAGAVTEHLLWDTGISATDGITANGTVTGSGDPNAVVTLTEGSTVLGTTTASGTGAWTFTPAGLPQGQNTIVASETDGAGNTGTASASFTLELIAPKATAIALSGQSITNGNGDLDAGNTVTITVNFDHPVVTTVTLIGTPYLKLNDGGKATYAGGAGTDTLTFTYGVAAGQNTGNLAVTGFSPGLIDAVGNAPVLGGTLTIRAARSRSIPPRRR